MKYLKLLIIIVLIGFNYSFSGDVTLTLIGNDPLIVNIAGATGTEEAGSINVWVYFNEDNNGLTTLNPANVDASPLEIGFGWTAVLASKLVNTGTYSKGGRTYANQLQYGNAGLFSLDDVWPVAPGVDALSIDWTAYSASEHVFIELIGDDGIADYAGEAHNVTFPNQEISLPVELSAFTAEDAADGVHLNWTTESEFENLGFMLERRSGDEGWSLIASYKTDNALQGRGSTSGATDYEYIDKLVEIGKEYEYRLGDVDFEGVVTYQATRLITVNNLVVEVIPEKFILFAAYPNPFNPHATIRFDTPKESQVKITIYNHLGQKVRVLQNNVMQPGEHALVWDSRDDFGQPVSAGVYLFNIEAGAFNKTHKMILLK
ncbi:FlgD immunoglobulin-like domain containing protein [Candidatus Neomarinimicrobiota bacterium]